MSELKNKIQSEIKTAMKAKQADRLLALRLIWSDIKKKEIDTRTDLDDSAVQKILQTMSKQVVESLDQAKGAGRDESAQEYQTQLEVIQEFLPKALSPEQLTALVVEVKDTMGDLPEGGKGMGMLMKSVMAKVGARSDGKSVQMAVKKALGM